MKCEALRLHTPVLEVRKPNGNDSSHWRHQKRERALRPFSSGLRIERPQLGTTMRADMAQSRKHNAWNEVMGLVLIGVGTILFLALISYTPKDVPSWVWFSSV